MYVGKKKSSNSSITSVQFYNAEGKGGGRVPWVPEVFLACGGKFRCWPKADTSSAVGRSREKNAGHYKDLTETGNRARKVSGTQGRDLSLGLEQGWDRAPHSEKKKKLVWAKKNIGERSERRGCPLGSLHSPIFFLFDPVFCLFPARCGAWSKATTDTSC